MDGQPGVGALLRQPTVRTPDGRVQRLDDQLGRGFAVIGRKDGDLQLGAEAQALLGRLGGRAVALDGLEVVEGALDRLFEAHAAVVLRPDRYVFGVVDDAHGLDALVRELGRKLALR